LVYFRNQRRAASTNAGRMVLGEETKKETKNGATIVLGKRVCRIIFCSDKLIF